MKKIIALSSIAILSTALYAATDADTKIAKLEKKLAKLEKKVSKVNSLAAKDNIKWDVDYRTSVDKLNYKMLSGNEYENNALMSHRLWLGMGYAPTDNILFRGQLSMNKAFGANYGQRATGMGFDTFDWVNNETLGDNTLKVREAYWLYTNTIGDVGITASVGRRPATNGFLANLRDDDKAKSPMGHVINMEFDGASASVKLDTYVPGMMFKVCLGRGLTNAVGWSNQASAMVNPFGGYQDGTPNYIESPGNLQNVDMAGFIFKPYDDGQYSVVSTWYRGFNVPGMVATNLVDMSFMNGPTMMDPDSMQMKSTGDMDGMAVSLKVDGIGDGISDFLDDTTIFASYAMSKSNPNIDVTKTITAGDTGAVQTMPMATMLGSADAETGTSYWIGAQMPNMTGGKFGLEYNHGDENWKPFTYGEDTMIGSKLAARGSAIEAYWTQPLGDALSMQVRYTKIDYTHTGSGGFFGDGSASMSMAEVTAFNQFLTSIGQTNMDVVESAQDIRAYIRYRY